MNPTDSVTYSEWLVFQLFQMPVWVNVANWNPSYHSNQSHSSLLHMGKCLLDKKLPVCNKPKQLHKYFYLSIGGVGIFQSATIPVQPINF